MKASIFQREPVLMISLIHAAIALGVAFGFHITADQMAALLTFAQVSLSVLARAQVTPIATIDTIEGLTASIQRMSAADRAAVFSVLLQRANGPANNNNGKGAA